MNDTFVFITAAGSILFLMIALFYCAMQRDELKTQAVQRGYAEYNQTNGVWQWKNSLTITNIVVK